MKKLRVEFYNDDDGDWRWRATAKNGRIVADSGEGYKRRFGAVRGAKATLKALKADLAAAEVATGGR